MSPRTGRPLKGETKRNNRVAIKLDDSEFEMLEGCVKETQKTRTEIIALGIELVRKELDAKKE